MRSTQQTFTPMPTTCEKLTNVCISTDEHTLLVRAFKEWSNHDSFTDADVDTVKAVFRRIFSHDTAMVGCTYGDALVMQPKNDMTLHYAMMVTGSNLQWKKAHVTCTNYQVLSDSLPFDDFLMITGCYDD